MNRDEARARAAEQPPRNMRHDNRNVEWIAPLDGEAGGTWIGTSHHRIHACLLNHYLPSDGDPLPGNTGRPSRGRIIADLLARGNQRAVQKWLRNTFDPTPFSSFLLIVLDDRHTQSISWDGHDLRFDAHDGKWLMFTSSSWRTSDVFEYRRHEFEAWLHRGAPHSGYIPAFHLLQPEDRLSWAPLMQRDHSATRSVTQIEMTSADRFTEMRYWPRKDLDHPQWAAQTLRLAHHNDPLHDHPMDH